MLATEVRDTHKLKNLFQSEDNLPELRPRYHAWNFHYIKTTHNNLMP
jgi:hypothetical protein